MRITNKFNIIALLLICGCGAASTDASETVGTDSAPLVNPIWSAFVLGTGSNLCLDLAAPPPMTGQNAIVQTCSIGADTQNWFLGGTGGVGSCDPTANFCQHMSLQPRNHLGYCLDTDGSRVFINSCNGQVSQTETWWAFDGFYNQNKRTMATAAPTAGSALFMTSWTGHETWLGTGLFAALVAAPAWTYATDRNSGTVGASLGWEACSSGVTVDNICQPNANQVFTTMFYGGHDVFL